MAPSMKRLSFALLLAACTPAPLYPPRPAALPAGVPIADPPPSRIVLHAGISSAGLRQQLESALPVTGGGTFQLSGTRNYTWQRGPLELRFTGRQIEVRSKVVGTAELPLIGAQHFPMALRALAEPVVGADYKARLQSVSVEITSDDTRVRAAQSVAGILDVIRQTVQGKVEEFAYDLRPALAEAHARVARPIPFKLGDAQGCAELRVTGLEAAPTQLADGVEKDFALLVAPSVTLPCAAPLDGPARALPPLANVAALPTGPFSVTVPIAARYEELARAMTLAFTDGKLFFSKDFPDLYLHDPEVYAGKDQLVLKLHLGGNVKKIGLKLDMGGDIFFAGHPTVVDNELRIPDLEPTIETSSFLLKLKAAIDKDSIRDQARDALRLDIGERLRQVRARLSTDLAVATGASGQGCLRSDVSRIEVTGVHPHASYLRLYVTVTAQAGLHVPCPAATASK